MSTLDCETFDSALRSCAGILDTTPEALLDSVSRFEYDAQPAEERCLHPYKDLFLSRTFGMTRNDLPTPSGVCWFHATRVAPGTGFEEGILPKSAIEERVWCFLGRLASQWVAPAEWQEFRQNMRGQGAQQYSWKRVSGLDEGPFAFLVRELIFQHEALGNHDYLGVPEIVEDICLSFEETFDWPLKSRFVESTRRCIVKFQTYASPPDVLGAALLYIHRASRGEDFLRACNAGFDGKNIAIPVSLILRVEWPGNGGEEEQHG